MSSEDTATKGKPSPSWGVWARFLIRCKNGDEYLARLRLVQTPLFGIYLHDIYEPDDGDPHNHPWPFVSIVLRGAYQETVLPKPKTQPKYIVTKHHRRFSAHFMGRHAAHRVMQLSQEPVKTLILVGPRSKAGWGFFRGGLYTPWQEYAGSR